MPSMFCDSGEAWGHCARCGQRYHVRELMMDGYIRGISVCERCYDPPHPQERLDPLYDPQGIRHASPDRDTPEVAHTFPGYDLTTGETYGPLAVQWALGQVTIAIT